MGVSNMGRKVPTYLLDENYYVIVNKLAIEMEAEITRVLQNTIKNYMQYLEDNKIEKLGDPLEYGLELIYIGVLYISYGKEEESTLYKQLDILCVWLDCTKEFNEIVVRFQMWLEYWRKHENLITDFINIMELTKTFLSQCERKLGQYTLQVPTFIQEAERIYKDREDVVFVTRHKNEYYINMVGAQIRNHVFRDAFKRVNQVFVFAPGCMEAQLDQCQGKETKMGHRCSKCTDTCPIMLTEQVVEKYNTKTVIVYHSSELYHTKVPSEEVQYGVVGIACVLNLIAGGLKAKALGYVPQCVLLNYCGCKQHWNFDGMVTDINRKRLLEILQTST